MRVTGSTIEQLEKGKPKGKCTRWRLWATTEHGRRSKRVTGTWTQAQEALTAFVAELEGLVPNADTFGSYALSWASWRAASGNLSPNGIKKDARNVRALCRTDLAGMRMDEIGPEDCRAALLWLKSHPANGEGELKNSTIATFHVALSSIMGQAALDGRIASNPMAMVKAPKVNRAERTALAPEEIGLLLNRLDALPLDGRVMAVYLIACLGLRRSEACAVAPEDVADGYAHVRSAVKDERGTIGAPKSEAGVRTIPMPPRLTAKVAEWMELRRLLGFADSPTLCCNTRGGLLSPANLHRWWTSNRSRIGCDGMVLHELRHSNLSMMARHMSPFDLQRYAGWSSIEPAKIYIHDDLDAVTAAVDSAWSGIGRTRNAPLAASPGFAAL